MRVHNRRLAWLISLAITAGLFLFIAFFLDWRYSQNDDISILRSFMGYETGEPAHFQIFIHGLLAWPIYWLAKAFPTVAWFSIVQIALLCLSCWMIFKSVMQCFVNRDKPLWMGTVGALALAAVFLELCTQITFTLTAGLLGAAAVAQVLSIDAEKGRFRQTALGVMGALPPTAFAYALRKEALWPVLAFLAVALLAVWLLQAQEGRRERRKALLLASGACVLFIAGLLGWRAIEVKNSGQDEYLAWQDARTRLVDYYDLSQIPPECYEAAGWTASTIERARSFFFLDSDITTESIEALLAALEATDGAAANRQSIAETLNTAVHGSTAFLWALGLTAVLWVLCLVGAAVQKERRAALLIPLLLGALLEAALILYLAIQGRMPTRVLWLVFLPFMALVAGLLPSCIPAVRLRFVRVAATVGLCCGVLCVSGLMLAEVIPHLLPDIEAWEAIGDPAAALDEYALANPDMLFIYDMTLAVDTRLFPDVSQGIPHNVVCWGGWPLRSPATVEQFAAFDIDLLHFDPANLLRYDVCIASGVVDPPPTLVIDYLREKVDPACDYMIYSEMGGVYFFQFY